MTNTILAGLALIDATGLTILGTTFATLVLGLLLNLWLRRRYAALEQDVRGRDERFPCGVTDGSPARRSSC